MADRDDDERMQQGAAQPESGDLVAQLAAARAEVEQLKDRYLRELADKDNYRKRLERIADDRLRREKRDLLEKILEVTDNLDRSMGFQETMDRDALLQGLRMMQWQLTEVLRSEGLTPIPTVGEQFDPYVHEAIEAVASAEHPEGAVVEEVRKGYKLGDETVRPARVKVNARPNG